MYMQSEKSRLILNKVNATFDVITLSCHLKPNNIGNRIKYESCRKLAMKAPENSCHFLSLFKLKT